VTKLEESNGTVLPFDPLDLSNGLLEWHFGDVYGRDAHLRIINDAVLPGGGIRAHTARRRQDNAVGAAEATATRRSATRAT
jgi:hypothetical protein